jgi:hypothetical protein
MESGEGEKINAEDAEGAEEKEIKIYGEREGRGKSSTRVLFCV